MNNAYSTEQLEEIVNRLKTATDVDSLEEAESWWEDIADADEILLDEELRTFAATVVVIIKQLIRVKNLVKIYSEDRIRQSAQEFKIAQAAHKAQELTINGNTSS